MPNLLEKARKGRESAVANRQKHINIVNPAMGTRSSSDTRQRQINLPFKSSRNTFGANIFA